MELVLASAKAIVAAVIAFLSSLTVVVVGDTELGDVTDGQWLTAVLAALITGAAVWGVPNAKSNT